MVRVQAAAGRDSTVDLNMKKQSGRRKDVAPGASRKSSGAAALEKRDRRPEDVIIEATVACFSRYGIRKTSMEDIAEAAQLSRPTLYRYFPSRKHLIVEVLVREVRDHTRLVAPVIRQHSYPPRALIEGIVFDISSAEQHPYTSIVVSEAGSELLSKVSGSSEILLEAMSEQWLPALTRWREDGYLRPNLRMDDVILWITLTIHSALGPSWISVPRSGLRRILATLVVPAIFDLEKLKKDFPGESMVDLAAPGPSGTRRQPLITNRFPAAFRSRPLRRRPDFP
jgi:AcrR family transcriptional regulator